MYRTGTKAKKNWRPEKKIYKIVQPRIPAALQTVQVQIVQRVQNVREGTKPLNPLENRTPQQCISSSMWPSPRPGRVSRNHGRLAILIIFD